MTRVLIMLALLLAPVIVSGQYNSATSNALSGISMLSDSVADYANSPILGETGISSSYHRPFNTPGIDILGLHSAISKGDLIIAMGTGYLHHEDYCKQNPYLNLNYGFAAFRFGVSGHLAYDSIKDEDGEYHFSYDLGVAYSLNDYRAEILLLQKGQDDERLTLSLGAKPEPRVSFATGYQVLKTGKNVISMGVRADLSEHLGILSSWQSLQNRFGLGIAVNLAQWTINYGIRSHPDLDYSHAISLDYSW